MLCVPVVKLFYGQSFEDFVKYIIMDTTYFDTIKSIIKMHKFKLLTLAILAIIAALLMISAVNMLSLPKFTPNQAENKKSSTKDKNSKESRQTNPKNPLDRNRGNNNQNQIIPNHPNLKDPEESKDSTLPKGSIDKYLEEKIRSQLPNVSIDMTREKQSDGFPSQKDPNSFVIQSGKKPQHIPILEVLGSVKDSYLKLTVMDVFTGKRWNMSQDPQYYQYKGDPKPGMRSVKIRPIEPSDGFIPVIGNAAAATFPTSKVVYFPEMGVFYAASKISGVYEMFDSMEAATEEMLENDDVDYTYSFDVPASPRLAELAESITSFTDSPYLKIKLIEKYLKDNYSFQTRPEASNPNQDATERFLFETKQGSQLDFLSSYVLLMRHAGIPARMATGYKLDPAKNYQIVYADQLRVYPEVKSRSYGWIPLSFFSYGFYVPPVPTTTEIHSADAVVKKGTVFSVKGTVTRPNGNPVDGLPVYIYLKKKKDEDCFAYDKTLVENGVFEVNCNLEEEMDVGNYQVVAQTLEDDTFRSSWSDPEMKVISETSLTLTSTKTVFGEGECTLSGQLVELLSKKPVKNGSIEVILDKTVVGKGERLDTAVIDGSFTKKLELEISREAKPRLNLLALKKYTLGYNASFKGTDFYIGTRERGQVNIWIIFWDRVIIIALLLLAFVLTMVLVQKKRKQSVLAGNGSLLGYALDESYPILSEDGSTEDKRIQVEFPLIGPEFPDVWGLNEPFVIRFSEQDGSFDTIKLQFNQKGIHQVNVFEEDRQGKPLAKRRIRIVCYREEVIGLGKSFFQKLCEKYPSLSSIYTPRELIERIPAEMDDKLQDVLDIMVLIFERAAYGHDTIGRNVYEKFYSQLIIAETLTREEL